MRTLFVFRVFEEKWQRDMFNRGELFMRTAKECAENKDQKGTPRGDVWEGRIIENIDEIYLEIDDEIVLLKDVTSLSRVPDFDDMPVLCLSYIPEKWLWKLDKEDGYFGVLSIDIERLEQMKWFGNYVSLCRFDTFISDMKKYVLENKAGLTYRKVEYIEGKRMAERKMESLNKKEKMLDFLFIKGIEFSGEQELRMVFHKTNNYENNVLNLNQPIRYIEEVDTIDDMIEYLTKHKFMIERTPSLD